MVHYMEIVMTVIVSTLFIAASMLSFYTIAATVARAMPRIEQVIAERNDVLAQPPRMIRFGEVRGIAVVRREAVVLPFAPKRVLSVFHDVDTQVKLAA
jgi:plasmid stabilization system protein ParE